MEKTEIIRIQHCSFCGKTCGQVECIIAGSPTVGICDECIDLAAEIIREGLGHRWVLED